MSDLREIDWEYRETKLLWNIIAITVNTWINWKIE